MGLIRLTIPDIIGDTEFKGNVGPRLTQLLLIKLCRGRTMDNILVNGFLRYNLKDWEGY